MVGTSSVQYYSVRLNNKNYKIHILVAKAFLENPENSDQVDHCSRDSFDNRACNLRFCTSQQNSRNRTKAKNTSSKCKGVTWDKQAQRWKTRIKYASRFLHLGFYISEEEAALVYNYFATKLFKEFAAINQQLVQEYSEDYY